MDAVQISDVLREGIFTALRVGAPMLLLSMLVGVLVAIFQAVTQIHEQTISFALKLTVVILICLFMGGRMMDTLVEYARYLFTLML